MHNSLIEEYKRKYNKEPEFSAKGVRFGLKGNEVVVLALLFGSEYVVYWEFRRLFEDDERYLLDTSGNAEDAFRLMRANLAQEY